jgi:hypothetical protein
MTSAVLADERSYVKPKTEKKCMTLELIREHLTDDVEIKTCLFGGWKARFLCGVVARIKKRRLGRIRRNKASYDDFEQAVFELCTLAQEVWGVIGIYGGASKEDTEAFIKWCEAYEFTVNDNPYRPFTSQQLAKYFGTEATAKREWTYGGWRITLANGSGAIIGGDKVYEVWGGGKCYEDALLLLNELHGYAVAAGSKENVLAGIAHGNALDGVAVIPELYTSKKVYQRVGVVCGAIFGLPGIMIGVVYNNILYGVLVGMVAGYIASIGYSLLFLGNSTAQARMRGQALKSAFPSIHGASASRKANIEDARKRGMLQ